MRLELLKMRVGTVGSLRRQTPAMFRLRWRQLCTAAGLQADMFTPYCLRRGGATFDFFIHANLGCSLLRGRCMCSRTARFYIRQGEEMLSRVALRGAQQAKAEHYRLIFLNVVRVVEKHVFKS